MTDTKGFNVRGDLLSIILLVLSNLFVGVWWASGVTKDIAHGVEERAVLSQQYVEFRNTQIRILTELSALNQALESQGVIQTNGGK